MDKLKLEHDKNVEYNKKYGFDVPFINEMIVNFNKYLSDEGKQFMNEAEESLKKIKEEDTKTNIHIKLVFNNDKERILFKELIRTTEMYPILITIGDYDFFFDTFDEEQDPIFNFSEEAYSFFSNDVEKLKTYLLTNKLQFSFKYNNIFFDDLSIKIVEKGKNPEPVEKNPEPVEIPKTEMIKSDSIVLKKAYKIKLANLDECVMVITDNPAEIFSRFTVDMVLSVKLIGNGVCI